VAARLDGPLEALPDPLAIEPIAAGRRAELDLRFAPPGSKSMTNRALLLAALGSGRSVVRGALRDADDTERMLAAIERLGARVAARAESGPNVDLTIDGVAGRWRVPDGGLTLELGNAGTATRFLAASALLADNPVTIDGDARMRERPIGELADGLGQLGARIEYLGAEGCPPLRVTPPARGETGASVRLGATRSGQFISALLLAAPWMDRGLTIRLDAPPTSASYVGMTLSMLAQLGIPVKTSGDMRLMRVEPIGAAGEAPRAAGVELGSEIVVEPDASSATYWWAAAGLLPGTRCTVEGIAETSLQGDAAFPYVLARMGVETGLTDEEPGWLWCRGGEAIQPVLAECADMPDAAVTLAVVCAFAEGASLLRGVRTLRDKECDRIGALRTELAKLGVIVEGGAGDDPDAMTITPSAEGAETGPGAAPIVFETYDDHRMAMALALVGLRRPNVSIANPACVAKTYPTFWRDFGRLVT